MLNARVKRIDAISRKRHFASGKREREDDSRLLSTLTVILIVSKARLNNKG